MINKSGLQYFSGNLLKTVDIQANKKLKLAQDLTEYPQNQYYVELLNPMIKYERFRSFNSSDIKEIRIDEETEKALFDFEEFSNKSVGKDPRCPELKLPKIPVDGPTGCRTIFKVINKNRKKDPTRKLKSKELEKPEQLVPFYLLVTDLYTNQKNSLNPDNLKAKKQSAISRLVQDLELNEVEGFDVKKFEKECMKKDYKYKEYVYEKIKKLEQYDRVIIDYKECQKELNLPKGELINANEASKKIPDLWQDYNDVLKAYQQPHTETPKYSMVA